jgi:hypothetical protein
MNWEAIGAIGEVAGAAAVVVTLFYFAVQIRNMRAEANADAFSRSDEGERQLRKMRMRHAPLIIKANQSKELGDEELLTLRELYLSMQSFAFHGYGGNSSLGRNSEISARNFARELNEQKCLRELYLQKRRTVKGASSPPIVVSFFEAVDHWIDVEDGAGFDRDARSEA